METGCGGLLWAAIVHSLDLERAEKGFRALILSLTWCWVKSLSLAQGREGSGLRMGDRDLLHVYQRMISITTNFRDNGNLEKQMLCSQ
jgi:hypothetical protein